jgi:hypothetical protein
MMELEVMGSDVFMSEFKTLDTEAPAEMGAVVEAVVRLSTFSERQILELVSEGQLGELFPFHPKEPKMLPPDFVAEADLEEASAMPLSRERRAALIQSSMPAGAQAKREHSRLAAALAWQDKHRRFSEE